MMYRDFYDAGYRILSLYRVWDNGQCECDDPACNIKDPKSAASKHPRLTAWQRSPMWDEEQLETMEEVGQFEWGYGVIMGSDLVVIDVDARNGGVESYGKFAEDYPSVASCGFIVQTGSGGGSRHLYFKAPEGVALQRHLKEYPGLDFQSGNCFVVGPGSKHRNGWPENPKTYEVVHGSVDDIFMLPDDITEALKKPERIRTEYNGGHVDVSNDLMSSILDAIPARDMEYDDWITVGMGINHSMMGDGYDLWLNWSSKSPKHDDSKMAMKWASFGRASSPVTIGTLVYMAEQNGWKWPVTFFDDDDKILFEQATNQTVDLLSPPGFVGELARWIESQGRFPRKHLAVASAIVSVGAIAGLRYQEPYDSVTPNLIAFCVAESATGKEAVMQSTNTVYRTAGISPAVHGAFKSEAELYKNLLDHQAAIYTIDELGIILTKVVNAQKRGGAAYLEGLFGAIMSAYSKANDFMPITGDQKREVKERLHKELASINKKMDSEGETPSLLREAERVQKSLVSIESGIENPFLSIIGYTTPSTFENLVDRDQAKSGFIGRSIIVKEKETNPRGRKGHKRPPMPDSMRTAIIAIANGDEYDSMQRRIEYPKNKIVVKSTPEAIAKLDEIDDLCYELGEKHKETSGLETLPRRAYEMVAKISFILAIPSRLRTLEHVIWAHEFVKRDIDTKVNMVVGTDNAGKTSEALMARLRNLLDAKDGTSFGVIKNRLNNYKPEDILKCLEKMGARKETETHKFNKKTIEKWFLY